MIFLNFAIFQPASSIFALIRMSFPQNFMKIFRLCMNMIEFVNIFTDLRTLAKIREHLAEKVCMHDSSWYHPPVGVDFANKFRSVDAWFAQDFSKCAIISFRWNETGSPLGKKAVLLTGSCFCGLSARRSPDLACEFLWHSRIIAKHIGHGGLGAKFGLTLS